MQLNVLNSLLVAAAWSLFSTLLAAMTLAPSIEQSPPPQKSPRSLTDSVGAECYGPDNATKLLIYLHGLDQEPPSAQELRQRTQLRDFAESQAMRIAAMRSHRTCPQYNKRCWPMVTEAELLQTWKQIEAAAQQCAPTENLRGIIGFSNGGYFLARLLNHCLHNASVLYFMVGSAGRLNMIKKDLKDCPRPAVFLGSDDKLVRQAAHGYAQSLDDHWKASPSTLVSFPGGHELGAGFFKQLKEVLRSW